MNQITTVIVDVEENISTLCLLIKQHCPELQIVGVARNVEESILLINKKKPELIFLDIDLPDGSGFEILKKINHTNYDVIFTAIQLKPISPAQLRNAVNRFTRTNGEINLDDKLRILKESLLDKPQKILFPTTDGLNVFNISEIVRCEAHGNYTTVYFNDKSHMLISKPIKKLNQILSQFYFSRVHNTHLVNLKYIQKYVKGRKPYIVLTNSDSIPISDTRKNQFVGELEVYAMLV